MTPLELAKKLIEAREKATQGEWVCQLSPTGAGGAMCYADAILCDLPLRGVKNITMYPQTIIYPDHKNSLRWRQDLFFTSLAANHITEVCERLIRVEGMLEKCKEQRNGWTKKYWWDQKMSADSIEDSIKKVMSNFDAELEKVGEK